MSVQHKPLRLAGGRFSFLISLRALGVLLLLTLLLLGAIILAIGAGSLPIPALDVVQSLVGEGDPMYTLVIQQFRLPRVLTAVLAGAALALSGGILQSVVRNPLASPDLMGVTSGAGLAAVAFLGLLNHSLGIEWLPLFAAAGAGLVAAVIYGLAWRDGVSPIRMVLIGVGITSLLGAARTVLMLQANVWQAAQSYTWLIGSLQSSNWTSVRLLGLWVLLLVPLLIVTSRYGNLHALGDDVARGAGSALQRERLLLIGSATALAGVAVAFVGGISFVALISPHIARRLVGPSYGALLPVSAVLGALILLLADLAGRSLFSPLDLPAGIFTALVGAPFFLYLLTRAWSR